MLRSNSMKVVVVMQVGAWRKYRHEVNMVQSNADDSNGEACTTNQTDTFVRIKYLKIVLIIIFCYEPILKDWLVISY